MKTRNVLLGICFILFTSCVVKSLHPFYTKETISFDKNFIGDWRDSKNGTWKVVSFISEMTKDNPVAKMKEDDLKIYKEYKNSYYILREFEGKKVLFIATPFKINHQKFLDFFPLDHQEDIDNLLESHSVYTHSLVKYDVQKNGEIEIKWLDEDKIKTLFKEQKIKIKHETFGLINEDYLLTANSKELQKFVEKYMASADVEKWETSTQFTLHKVNARN
ncbi:hypothetical protein [Polaribacter glomeratus]|uniref:Lipoprotein n=1 Tax=Polaribacter glomeratus TaxID=102 RepID=A0A2S7WGT6_9FLAO|nr:hypothetical protein [Polaribacter glomeratus]PQJ76819.1 hypothetical protein BTO16_13170 [Polaribacter glomeratus]TXD67338.1 hypothetical protein ESX12_01745 [Polaribacter glomeratus]